MIETKPQVMRYEDGSKSWGHSFERMEVVVYVPYTPLPEQIINYGYDAPYLIVFSEKEMSGEEARAHAKASGLESLAAEKASSVVYVWPKMKMDVVEGTSEEAMMEGAQQESIAGGTERSLWENAPEGIFEELIENSKVHQYHEDGMAILMNRFTNSCDGYAIRAAIFRSMVFARGAAADYVARNLCKTINGQGLWGPADVTPAVCVLENLSILPQIERGDIPIVSIGNSDEINGQILGKAEHCLVVSDEGRVASVKGCDDVREGQYVFDCADIVATFAGKYMRWVGNLQVNPDFEQLGMQVEVGTKLVKTSPDNCGDDAGSSEHVIGYISYYNKGIFAKGPAPLLLAFHGGGDSAMNIAMVSEWYRVAHDHDFLLVCVENHLNSTATEMMELIAHLKERYKVDSTRIYASGFSMGGCKSWDLYQEYPQVFAGLAPMCATFEVGLNVYGKPSPGMKSVDVREVSAGAVMRDGEKDGIINRSVMTPIFYVGGEDSPLPELPFQAQKCFDRASYVLEVNGCTAKYDTTYEEKDSWKDSIYGISGDRQEQIADESRGSTLTLRYFASSDGKEYTVFCSVSGQQHECRYHSCEHAWRFLQKFRRNADGCIVVKSK